MKKVNENVYQFENLLVSNVYLIMEDDVYTLVDTGMLGDLPKIKRQLKKMGIEIEQIDNIIITHSHGDHIANLKKIASLTDAKVYVHKGDYEDIKDKVKAENIISVEDKEVLDIYDLEVIHISGHTAGNMALYSKNSKLLFSGDCIFNNNGFSLPPIAFNKDTNEFKKNIKKLLQYDIEIICFGHGPFLEENCNQAIAELLDY